MSVYWPFNRLMINTSMQCVNVTLGVNTVSVDQCGFMDVMTTPVTHNFERNQRKVRKRRGRIKNKLVTT